MNVACKIHNALSLFQDFMVNKLAAARGGDMEAARQVVSAFFSRFERRVTSNPVPEVNVFFYFFLTRK